jgi:hypothetical protein
MTRKTPANVGASVRARLLTVSKARHEDFTLTLMNYAAERFLYRLSRSPLREQFVLKGAMLFAVRIGEQYRSTRDLDLLGIGEPSEAAILSAVRAITETAVEDDGLVFDVDTLEVHAIREDTRYGGIRAIMQARLAQARIHVQIDVGFGDVITPAAMDMNFPTLLDDMASPNVLAYPNDTIVAEKAEAIVILGLSNSRMKDFTDIAMAARRWSFDGRTLVNALQATFRRRHTSLPDDEIVGFSARFVQDERARANWKSFVTRNHPLGFASLDDVVSEVRDFLQLPLEHARTERAFTATWNPGGPWV